MSSCTTKGLILGRPIERVRGACGGPNHIEGGPAFGGRAPVLDGAEDGSEVRRYGQELVAAQGLQIGITNETRSET